jgi:hypothetical protein
LGSLLNGALTTYSAETYECDGTVDVVIRRGGSAQGEVSGSVFSVLTG